MRSDTTLYGQFRGVVDNAIWLETRGSGTGEGSPNPLRVKVEETSWAEYLGGSHKLRRTLLGAGFGIAAGVLTGSLIGDIGEVRSSTVSLTLGALLASIGALLGLEYGAGTDSWHRVRVP